MDKYKIEFRLSRILAFISDDEMTYGNLKQIALDIDRILELSGVPWNYVGDQERFHTFLLQSWGEYELPANIPAVWRFMRKISESFKMDFDIYKMIMPVDNQQPSECLIPVMQRKCFIETSCAVCERCGSHERTVRFGCGHSILCENCFQDDLFEYSGDMPYQLECERCRCHVDLNLVRCHRRVACESDYINPGCELWGRQSYDALTILQEP